MDDHRDVWPPAHALNPARPSGGRTARCPPIPAAARATATSTSCRSNHIIDAEQLDDDRRALRLQPLPRRRQQLRRRLRRGHARVSRRRFTSAPFNALPASPGRLRRPATATSATAAQQHRPTSKARPSTRRDAGSRASTRCKIGVDYRRPPGRRSSTDAPNNGNFAFTQGYTQGPNAEHGEHHRRRRDSPASCSAIRRAATSTWRRPASSYTDYYSAYAQDDYRVSVEADAELRPALRVRAGHRRARRRVHRRLRSHAPVPDSGARAGPQGRADVCRRGRQPDAPGSSRSTTSRRVAASPTR